MTEQFRAWIDTSGSIAPDAWMPIVREGVILALKSLPTRTDVLSVRLRTFSHELEEPLLMELSATADLDEFEGYVKTHLAIASGGTDFYPVWEDQISLRRDGAYPDKDDVLAVLISDLQWFAREDAAAVLPSELRYVQIPDDAHLSAATADRIADAFLRNMVTCYPEISVQVRTAKDVRQPELPPKVATLAELAAVDPHDYRLGVDVWKKTSEVLPAERVLVETISPSGLQSTLNRSGSMWFTPGGEMYVYYYPVLWRMLQD